MELIYSVSPSVKIRRDWGREDAAICSLSARNTIAFTSSIVLNKLPQAEGDRGKSSKCLVEGWNHIYICDIDKPWEIYHITSFKEKVIALKWHPGAGHILIATNTGTCQIWEMQDHLINDWTCIQTNNTTEELVAIAWLHNGNRVAFDCDMKDSPLYTDKIVRSKFKPSLSHFGGKPVDGWLAVTSTGLICVGLLANSTGNKDVQIKKETLGSWRSRIQVADLAFDSCGDVLVVASDGYISSTVQSYKVSLAYEKSIVKITCNATASLFAKCHMDKVLEESPTSRITHIRFMHDDSGESLIVAAGDTNCSHVELWNSTNEVSRLHRFYQASVETTYTTQRWVHQHSITHGSLPISLATPRFPVCTKPQPDPHSVLFQYVAIAYRDGSVKLVGKSDFKPKTTTNLDIGMEVETGDKKRRVVAHMIHMQQTLTGCGLVGLDQYHSLYVMKVVNTRDPVTQINTTYLVGIMEYLISNGFDWWELLTAIRPGVVETIIQKLSDNFSKQTPVVQELMYSQFMAVKGSLFRASSGQQRAADCHCKLVLHSINTLFKSILRPKSISGLEKSPAEKLTANCSKNFEVDIDKVIVTLNPEKKEFVVESTVLQSMQQLIQWIADITLYLLSSLHMMQSYSSFPGSLLLRDSASLGALRELIVVVRIWGMINESCLPHFLTTSTNFDVLSHLFKLLTRVWLAVKDPGGGGEFEEALIDDCCLLSSQVIAPPVDEGLFGDSRYGASVFLQNHPLKFVFSQMPAHVVRAKSALILPDGQSLSRQRRDIVRFVTLGADPSDQLRQCSRCSCLSHIRSSTKVMKAWELRFTKSCVCGGQWKRYHVHAD